MLNSFNHGVFNLWHKLMYLGFILFICEDYDDNVMAVVDLREETNSKRRQLN